MIADFNMTCHHQVEWEWVSLSQIELVWVRVLCKMAESKMAEFKMAEFKMVAIIKLIRLELVWVRVRLEWRVFFELIWEKITRCLNPRWQCQSKDVSEFERKNWIKMAECKMARIQDDCHHQVKWEWMSLSQIELVCVRARMEWECFWVILREDNKVSQSKMAVSESNIAEF